MSCGKRIPDDVALVGFDEIELLNILGHNISVVSRATSEMGEIATRLLLDRIEQEDNKTYQRIVLQSHLKSLGSEKIVKA